MTPRTLAENLIRLMNERDVESALRLLDADVELCFPRFAPRAVFRGHEEVREFVAWLTEMLPVRTFAVGRIVSAEASATVEFEIAARSAAGHLVDNVGVIVLDAEDGRIRRLRAYVDTADLGRVLEVA